MNFTRRFFLRIVPLFFARIPRTPADEAAPFGSKFPGLDSLTTGEWWSKGTRAPANNNTRAGVDPAAKGKARRAGGPPQPPSMNVPREEVVCFAYYTHQNGVLKMSAQLFPLKPGKDRVARLELKRDNGEWQEVASHEVLYTVRVHGDRFHPRVYSTGSHTIKVGPDKPDAQTLTGLEPKPKNESGQRIMMSK